MGVNNTEKEPDAFVRMGLVKESPIPNKTSLTFEGGKSEDDGVT